MVDSLTLGTIQHHTWQLRAKLKHVAAKKVLTFGYFVNGLISIKKHNWDGYYTLNILKQNLILILYSMLILTLFL